MQAAARRELGQLTYCTNIHPGETWPEVRAALSRHLPAIRREAAPGRPFGVGLRLAAAAAKDLENPASITELQSLLAAEDCYVFTINGFPYGSFHGTRVKEEVYAPDWSTPERLAYTLQLFDLLVQLGPGDVGGSVSTVPASFKGFMAAEPARREKIFANLTV